ncbi:MAG: DEAD/DEAH box helicase family protein [Lysobacteraceae bacterium]
MSEQRPLLPLATSLTRHTRQLCLGLEDGDADILELVTPTTAELLRWWFMQDTCDTRAVNFHAGQRQAILNVIVAHEVLGSHDLKDLYQQVCAEALLEGGRLAEVSQPKHAHPKYCLKMATGTGKTWVLQALLVWQVLNANAAREEGREDARFTRRFLVVAPGLIVYERLLDAFLGKEHGDGSGLRDASRSDLAVFGELFVPPAWREPMLQFVAANTCAKQEIGLKATGNGLIAIANWHLLKDAGEENDEWDEDAIDAPALTPEAHIVAKRALPLTPGLASGNALDALDRRWQRGNVLAYLADLPDLMVFNDEAHHIHEVKKDGEVTEVEWQKSLSRIAEGKGRRFAQVDFSATPYNDVGGGRNRRKVYFPHIVVDFDLVAAMKAGLVKSLVLDKRRELGAMPLEALEFKAERDDDGNIALSAGQRVMLRAGLHKLRKLEADFARIDPARHPKMLVVCEDTKVTPLVADFLMQEGLADDEVMSIDSGRKAELSEKDWLPIRERLFDVDAHATPRVIVSVLMLREGFDVNNVCVIVPLRSSQASILLEQLIGRGLRLMWRGEEFDAIKRENRERIAHGQEPGSLIDVLSIVEHPAFEQFYDELMREGLVGTTTGELDATSSTGDLESVDLREGFERYDFAIPFVLHESDEAVDHAVIDVGQLGPFREMTLKELKDLLGKGDVFTSQDLQSRTLFGDYRVDGAVMSINGYNEWLSRMTRRISQALQVPLPGGNQIADHMPRPYWQAGSDDLAASLDDYVREQLFNTRFEPFEDEQWRMLLLQPVVEHVVRVFALAFKHSEQAQIVGETRVHHRHLSEVTRITVRQSSSLEVSKCIYPRLPYPARNGGLERAFIEWADSDAGVAAFCKVHEQRHDFIRLRYVKNDGMAASYSPDFVVRVSDRVYLVETKAQQQILHPNVQRKLRAAAAWCERINAVPGDLRNGLEWHYALVGEDVFFEWRQRGARLADLLDFARVRTSGRESQQKLRL